MWCSVGNVMQQYGTVGNLHVHGHVVDGICQAVWSMDPGRPALLGNAHEAGGHDEGVEVAVGSVGAVFVDHLLPHFGLLLPLCPGHLVQVSAHHYHTAAWGLGLYTHTITQLLHYDNMYIVHTYIMYTLTPYVI